MNADVASILEAVQALDFLANVGLILIGLETLRQRDRITRVEGALDLMVRKLERENS